MRMNFGISGLFFALLCSSGGAWADTLSDEKALSLMVKECSECHNKEGHPGAKFLQKANLSDKETVHTIINALTLGKMPKFHIAFRDSKEGKQLLDWLRQREKFLSTKK